MNNSEFKRECTLLYHLTNNMFYILWEDFCICSIPYSDWYYFLDWLKQGWMKNSFNGIEVVYGARLDRNILISPDKNQLMVCTFSTERKNWHDFIEDLEEQHKDIQEKTIDKIRDIQERKECTGSEALTFLLEEEPWRLKNINTL